MPQSTAFSAHACRAATNAIQPAASGADRPALVQLCRQIDDAFDAGGALVDPSQHAEFSTRLRVALAEVGATSAWLTHSERVSNAQQYCRHLLAADPLGRYTVVSLVWRPGQWSPVHGHRTWCGYTVLDGTLTETLYDWNEAAGHATEVRCCRREVGAVSFVRAGATGIHRLGHDDDAAQSAPAVSLPVYGVPVGQIATHVNDLVAYCRIAPAVNL
ncbi:cysteine dioxygenase family protein [Burkholderia territorii]|uniref:cysteine dioxygenase family protein n=1 Tax=Burkholderia territorii TaxID=1503055 RepID=UPI0009BE6272|nr:cysteine dioxygenase family protein [Burkholderia territorii]